MASKPFALGTALLVAIGTSTPAPAQQSARPQTQPTQPAADVEPEFKAEVLGVRITRELPESLRTISMASAFISHSRGTGAQVLLLLSYRDGRIVEADPSELRIDEFIDDKRRDLRPRPDVQNNYYGTPTAVTSDGRAVIFLGTDKEPDPGAERLLVRGSIRLKTTSGQKESDKVELPLRVGQSVKVGEMTLTVSGLSLVSGAKAQGVNVTFQTQGPAATVSKVAAFDENGQPLTATIGSRSINPRADLPSQLVLHIGAQVEQVQLQFSYSEEMRDQVVPFEVQIDSGIARFAAIRDDAKPDQQPPADAPRGAGDQPADGPRRAAAWPERAPGGQFPERDPARWPPPREGEAVAAVEDLGPAIQNARVEALSVAASIPPSHDRPVGVDVMLTPCGLPQTRPASGWPINPASLFQPFGGTQLQLLVSAPGERLVGLELAKMSITSFADDTGVQLSPELMVAPPMPGPFRSVDAPSPPLAAYLLRLDGQGALLRLGLKDPPSRGAREIRVRGSIPVQLAGPLRNLESQPIELRPGADLAPEGSGFRAVVNSVSWGPPSPAPPVAGPPPQPGSWLQVVVQSDLPPERLQQMRMVTDAGEPVMVNLQIQQTSTGSTEAFRHYYHFLVNTKADRVKAQWSFFEATRPAVVPFDIVIGLGLGPVPQAD